MKKILFVLLAAAVLTFSVNPCVLAAEEDSYPNVLELREAAENYVMDFASGASATDTALYGFYGPYFDGQTVAMSEETGVSLDLSPTDWGEAWFTSELANQDLPTKRYAVIEIKADNPEKIETLDFSVSGERKPWGEWIGEDGNPVPAITENWQTLTIDLFANGLTDANHNITYPNNGADVRISGTATQGTHLYVKTITFTNKVDPSQLDPDKLVPPEAHVMDFVKGAVDFSTEARGFIGPFFEGQTVELSEENGICFDMDPEKASEFWVTLDVSNPDLPTKQYAVFEIKAESPQLLEETLFTFGWETRKWTEWIGADGKTLPALTEEWQTITIDLFANGVDDPEHNITKNPQKPDFRVNNYNLQGGKIYIKSITFTNESDVKVETTEPPKEPISDVADATKEVENTTAKQIATTNKPVPNPSTGVEGFGLAIAVATATSVILLFSKKIKNKYPK